MDCYDLNSTKPTRGFSYVVLTPSHPPPPPSSIPTKFNSDSYMEVLKRITRGDSAVNSTLDHGIAPAKVNSTYSQHRESLTFQYGHGTDTNRNSSCCTSSSKFPLKPNLDKITPIFRVRNKPVRSEQAYNPTRYADGPEKLAGAVCSQVTSIRNDTSNIGPFPSRLSSLSSQVVSTVKRSSSGMVPCTLKQTKLVAEENSGNSKLAIPKVTRQNTTRDTVKGVTPNPKELPKPILEQHSKPKPSPLKDVRNMASEELKELEEQLMCVEEVAACLLYSDGSSQLRPNTVKGKGAVRCPYEAEGLCLAYPVKNKSTPVLHYVFLPLDQTKSELSTWCRKQLLAVLRVARVITYGGQRVAATIISCFDLLSCTTDWLQWSLLDTHVGMWLLNPDHPAESFAQVLARCDMQLPTTNKISPRTQVCTDLSLVGPVMVRIYQKLQNDDLWVLYEKIEVKLIPILATMDVRGIQVNCNKLLEYAKLLKIKISKVEERAHKAAGHQFSINSTAQLRQVLFEELRLDDLCNKKLSKTLVYKQKSTSEAVLSQLEGFHPLPGLVLEYRQLCKMNATYISGVLPYISEGILKASWQHTGAATGRLVSSNPNIQAFPKQSVNLGVVKEQFIVGKEAEEVTIDIRETVESRSGCTFIAADFKSIELRLVAHFSEDKLLISTLNSKGAPDVFVHLASEWLGVDMDNVTAVHRERTKRVVYAVVYGVGKERLAEILNVQPSYAKDLTSSFLGKFPGVQNFITKTIEECRKAGYLETICRRKRWFPHISSTNVQLRLQSERQAVNFVVQGSAADICKCGMVEVSRLLARDHPDSRLLLQIHDEMLFEVPDADINDITDKLKLNLESSGLLDCNLKVPLEVRLSAGKTWSALRPLSD